MSTWDAAREGEELHGLVTELYPICRSITGDGVRRSLDILGRRVSLERKEVPSGTPVFDWTVPPEWNIRDAWIGNSGGERVVDFRRHNLHVLNYSVPVRTRLSFAELRPHLFTRPDLPEWIPYRTSYYTEAWGFCLNQSQWKQLEQDAGELDVCIESTLEPGHLTYGEFLKRGDTDREFLFSCHSCHPSLANDNASGMAVTARLAQLLSGRSTRLSYRFLWLPGTIGAITWLARNESALGRIDMGLVISCVGDPGPFTYKQSRRGTAAIDQIVEQVLHASGDPHRVRPFTPLGYDERQYGSPGINLPVGCFMRTPHGEYPEYHTSADNLQFVTVGALSASLFQLWQIVEAAERFTSAPPDATHGRDEGFSGSRRDCGGSQSPSVQGVSPSFYNNVCPKGEPQLGRRGLYRNTGGTSSARSEEALLWVLNFSDGHHSLEEIAERAGLTIAEVQAAAKRLEAARLLEPVELET